MEFVASEELPVNATGDALMASAPYLFAKKIALAITLSRFTFPAYTVSFRHIFLRSFSFGAGEDEDSGAGDNAEANATNASSRRVLSEEGHEDHDQEGPPASLLLNNEMGDESRTPTSPRRSLSASTRSFFVKTSFIVETLTTAMGRLIENTLSVNASDIPDLLAAQLNEAFVNRTDVNFRNDPLFGLSGPPSVSAVQSVSEGIMYVRTTTSTTTSTTTTFTTTTTTWSTSTSTTSTSTTSTLCENRTAVVCDPVQQRVCVWISDRWLTAYTPGRADLVDKLGSGFYAPRDFIRIGEGVTAPPPNTSYNATTGHWERRRRELGVVDEWDAWDPVHEGHVAHIKYPIDVLSG